MEELCWSTVICRVSGRLVDLVDFVGLRQFFDATVGIFIAPEAVAN